MIRFRYIKNKLIFTLLASLITVSTVPGNMLTAMAEPLEEETACAAGTAVETEYVEEDAEEIAEIETTGEEIGIVFDNLDPVPHVPDELIEEELMPSVGGDMAEITANSVRYIPVGHFSLPNHINYNTNAKQQSIKKDAVNGIRTHVNETCWAFATVGALETAYNKNNNISNSGIDNKALTTADGALDLSERQLVYFTYFNDNKTGRDPLATLENDNNYLYIGGTTLDTAKKADVKQAFALGGNTAFSFETVAMGIGPVSENAVPYSTEDDPTLNEQTVDSKYKFTDEYNMKSGRVFDMSQRNLVKSMILKYGSAATAIYYDNKYLNTVSDNGLNTVYFHHPSTATNHQILIVGWDDEIPIERFKSAGHAAGSEETGGWLCKNSYGDSVTRKTAGTRTEWGYDEGYFWVSYDTTDALLGNNAVRRGYTFDMDKVESEDVTANRIYQYDGTTFSKEITAGSAYANVFNVKATAGGEREYLRSVMVKLATPGSVYSVQLYGNPDEADPTQGTPILKAPIWGSVDAAGYYDVDLGRGIDLDGFDKVAVVVNLYKSKLTDDTPAIYSSVSGKYTMSVATNSVIKAADGAKTVKAMLYCLNTTKVGHSYIYNTSTGMWEDMFRNADSKNIKGNVRIKLKTVVKNAEEKRVDPDYTEIDHYVKKKKATASITQPVIEIDPEDTESGSTLIYVGQTAKISIKDKKDTTWTSKKIKVATVDDTGLILGIKKGTTQLTGVAGDGTKVTHKIIVRNPSFVCKTKVAQITVSGQLEINGGFQDVQWISAKPDVVSVDEKTGSFKALKSGSSAITAIVGTAKLKCRVRVPKPVLKEKSIVLAPEAPSAKIRFTNSLIDMSQVEFQSSDESIVKVDQKTGILTGVANGKAVVNVQVLGTPVKCKVLVTGY